MNRTPMFLVVAALVLFASPLLADSDSPEVLADGLVLVKENHRGDVYTNPDVDWSSYDQIQLDTATVEFRKNWKRDQNRYRPFKVTDADMEKIKTELSALFNEVFSEELSGKGHYEMVSGGGGNVMRISPQIVNLDVFAPDTKQPYIERDYTRQAGRMTLKLEIYDAATGQLLGTASNRQDARHRGRMQWTTSVSNMADARQMLQRWARDLRKGLNEGEGPTL